MESWQRIPDGCSKHPECDTCPFDDCKAYARDMSKTKGIETMRKKVLHMAWNKLSTEVISQRTGYSERHVRQIISEGEA